MTQVLEAVDDPQPDPLDRTGFRCQAQHDEIGKCHRRFDHVTRGDDWHHAITGYDPATGQGPQHWRWKDT